MARIPALKTRLSGQSGSSALIALTILVILLVLAAGCTGTTSQKESWSVDGNGVLSLTVPAPSATETVLSANDSVTLSKVVFHTELADVVTYVAAPENPKAAIIFVPGAGENGPSHFPRLIEYAKNGYAFMYQDVRGNGAETPGTALNFQADYSRYTSGTMPQYYRIVGDVMQSREYLADKYHVPVYALGSSNGGRYALIAAALDPGFSGYFGVSTSGFGVAEDSRLTGDQKKFLLSIDPDTYVAGISPRPVLIFHAPNDPIINYTEGQTLYGYAKDPKQFFSFNGTHGLNSEVDQDILTYLAGRS
ncbi:MAG: alpha/beta hydrolase [Methanoregulaceae archaeon]